MQRLLFRFATLALAAAVPFVAGCPNPNTYGTPRTLDPGKVQHTIALEGVGIVGADGGGGVVDPNFILPTLPTYQLRVGVVDGFDIGVRAAQLTSLGADFKVNFLRSDVLDLAVDPGFQVTGASVNEQSFLLIYGHVPVLVGINVTDWFTVNLTPGLLIVGATAETEGGSGQDAFAAGAGLAARAGVGFNFRLSDTFAITPEVTGMKPFEEGSGILLNMGLGFSFGAQPDYSALAGKTNGPAPGGPGPAAPR